MINRLFVEQSSTGLACIFGTCIRTSIIEMYMFDAYIYVYISLFDTSFTYLTHG